MADRDRMRSRRSRSPGDRRGGGGGGGGGGRGGYGADVRDVRDYKSGGGGGGGGGMGRRRSRSRSRSRSRDRGERRRKKRTTSLWDVPPSAQTQQMALSNPAFAGLHPSRVSQLLAMNAMPTGDSAHSRGGGGGGGGGGRDVRDVRDGRGRSPPRDGMGAAGLSIANAQMTAQQTASRQARRLYVGNLLPDTTEDDLKIFFSKAMTAARLNGEPGDCVASVYLNLAKKFGFIELRTTEEASACMSLDGITFKGQVLKVRRPSDYNPSSFGAAANPMGNMAAMGAAAAANLSGGGGGGGGMMGMGMPMGLPAAGGAPAEWNGQISGQVPDGPNKVFCGGLPYSLTEPEVKELLAVYGPLRAFHLVRDKEKNESKGFCFFEYVNPSVTDEAVKGLNGLEIRGKTLTVRRAQARAAMQGGGGGGGMGMGMMGAAGLGAMGANPLFAAATLGGMQIPGLPTNLGGLAAGFPGLPAGFAGLGGLPAAQAVGPPPTKVLCLSQMVTAEELANDTEYKEIVEDIESECKNYGTVLSIVVPRPVSGQNVIGVGKVFVEYAESAMTAKARSELDGRPFANRVVAASFFDEARFKAKDYA